MGEPTQPADAGMNLGTVPVVPMRAGKYEVRLARTPEEIEAAQKLRYRVMYEERGGRPALEKVRLGADVDEWDDIAWHVIVTDTTASSLSVLGTLRLVSNLRLKPGQKFYTEEAFDLSALREHFASILELGRFCIDASGRQGVILMLIWKWTMQFIVDNHIDVMTGCASFPGMDVERHRDVLGFLYRNNLAPEALRPRPVLDNFVNLSEVADSNAGFDEATKDIPTLLRGYLKLGARVSDAAILDPVFNTTFIAIYVVASEMLLETTVLNTSRRA